MLNQNIQQEYLTDVLFAEDQEPTIDSSRCVDYVYETMLMQVIFQDYESLPGNLINFI